jgi:Fe-S cluster assembly protein SufD
MTNTTSTSVAPTGVFTPEAFAARLAADSAAPAWWRDRRRAAYERFAALPMPSRKDEAWRFSNLSGLSLEGVALGPTGKDERLARAPFGPSALTFLNGERIGDHAVTGLPSGVIVTTLRDAAAKHADLLKEHFMAQEQKLAALHAAFVADGAFIHVPKGVEVADPIVVVHAAGSGMAVFPHTLVIAGDNAKVTVVDYFVSVGSNNQGSAAPTLQLAVGANDLYAGHGAALIYIGAQDWSRSTLAFQLNSIVVGRDAKAQSLNLHLGGKQARHESHSQLRAPGAFSEMLALTVASENQEFDQRTLQIHQAPDTKSDLLYKNTLRDKSRTVFSGLIIVDPDAQRTDAYQSNRNLMLSEDAEASSLPGLEIQANDVRCTHGATSSRIDPEQEFYLQSRGITRAAADELITFGFFEEVLNRLENDGLHEALRDLIRGKFQK